MQIKGWIVFFIAATISGQAYGGPGMSRCLGCSPAERPSRPATAPSRATRSQGQQSFSRSTSVAQPQGSQASAASQRPLSRPGTAGSIRTVQSQLVSVSPRAIPQMDDGLLEENFMIGRRPPSPLKSMFTLPAQPDVPSRGSFSGGGLASPKKGVDSGVGDGRVLFQSRAADPGQLGSSSASGSAPAAEPIGVLSPAAKRTLRVSKNFKKLLEESPEELEKFKRDFIELSRAAGQEPGGDEWHLSAAKMEELLVSKGFTVGDVSDVERFIQLNPPSRLVHAAVKPFDAGKKSPVSRLEAEVLPDKPEAVNPNLVEKDVVITDL